MKKEKTNHQAAVERAMEAIRQAQKERGDAQWRPAYHVAARAGWINDPNGFCFYDGQYHLFYQYHPFSAQWGPMHWGHAASPDLVHWNHLPIALAPGEPYDKDGCFSGSALEKDGKLYLLYTGHVDLPPGNSRGQDRIETQNLAVSEDGVHFEKYAGNPVISYPASGDIHQGHMRDPKMWRREGRYYCVIGSRKASAEHGQALLYTSEDLIDWKFVSVMASSDGDLGFMWECPDFTQIGETGLLLFSPQGVEPQGRKYLNLHQSGYAAGTLNYGTGVFCREPFELLDYGFDFYAPQSMIDDKGRCVMIAWMDMWKSEMPEQKNGWAGMMTIPRALSVENGKVIAAPPEELKHLRVGRITREDVAVGEATRLDGVAGDVYEMDLTLDLSGADGCELSFRVSKTQRTTLRYDKSSRILSLNRDLSSVGPKGERQAAVSLEDCLLKLRIFMDRSSIEVFAQGGRRTMSARIYPGKDATGVLFAAEGEMRIRRLDFYPLKQIWRCD